MLFAACVWMLVDVGAASLAWAQTAATVTATPSRPSWSFGLRSTGYLFKSVDDARLEHSHFQAFHHFTGSASGLAGGHLKFRGSGRFADDLRYHERRLDTSRLYTGYLEARLHPRMRARVGRQFIQSGVTGLTLDGAWLSVQPNRRLDLTIWAGGRAPFDHGFTSAKLDRNPAVGGRVGITVSRSLRLGLAAAYRENNGRIATRPVGVDLKATAWRTIGLTARTAYDLENHRWGRIEARALWRPAPDLPLVSVQYLNRYPAVDAASYFSRFAGIKRIRLARATVRYERDSHFGGELEYLGSFVDGRSSTHLGVAALFPGGRLGYSARLGDVGEQSGVFGEVAYQPWPWLRLEGEISHLIYALIEQAPESDERHLTAFAARVRATLRPGLRILAELQSLDNPYFSKDVRFLLGVDLSLARGSSRLGLDRGGWL